MIKRSKTANPSTLCARAKDLKFDVNIVLTSKMNRVADEP